MQVTLIKVLYLDGNALMAGWLLYCSSSMLTGQPARARRSNRLWASMDASAALLSTVGGSWQGSPTSTTRPEPAAGTHMQMVARGNTAGPYHEPGVQGDWKLLYGLLSS